MLIFIRRHPTAIYLSKRLKKEFRNLSIECMVEKVNGILKLRGTRTRQRILKDFSPSAHKGHRTDKEIDILICTDADSMGVDLPDVNVAVNYDCPEGADVLFQRAGRIMRMTNKPDRTVYFYTFIPSIYKVSDSESLCRKDINNRFERLIRRHKKSTEILETDVFTHDMELDISLESDIDTESFANSNKALEKLGGFGSRFLLEHSLTLNKHKERNKELSGFLHSASEYSGDHKKIFLLLQGSEKLHKVLYNLDNDELESATDLSILNMISCPESTERALVSPEDIDQAALLASEKWCHESQIDIGMLEKLCVLMLIPNSYKKDRLIKEFVTKRAII